MPQTFYIESDEEIISVIGRLRKSSAEKNIFVFPKRALVLQSIINLRLFQREAEKLGKKIVIVSQDEMGKMLAAVEEAQLEGELKTAAAARAFVKKNFPLAKKPARAAAGAKRKGR